VQARNDVLKVAVYDATDGQRVVASVVFGKSALNAKVRVGRTHPYGPRADRGLVLRLGGHARRENPSPRLPAEVTSFVGRRRELAEVKRLLERTRLLTLTGAGGCGKSRLAERAAAELARAFPGGVCLVELVALDDPALLVHAALHALDLRDQTTVWPLATLTGYLAERRLLLVLDNCEHLRDACAVLVDAVLHACAEVCIVTTSCQPLGAPGEATLRVPSLSLPDPGQMPTAATWRSYETLALFEDRAAAVDPAFTINRSNASAAVGVCRRLDGIPLAIELAAVWVRTIGITQILERLDDRFRSCPRAVPSLSDATAHCGRRSTGASSGCRHRSECCGTLHPAAHRANVCLRPEPGRAVRVAGHARLWSRPSRAARPRPRSADPRRLAHPDRLEPGGARSGRVVNPAGLTAGPSKG
jgi:hypothetical protein